MPIIEWQALDANARAALLQRPSAAIADTVFATARATIRQVRDEGDVALRALTERFDGVALQSLTVSDGEFDAACAGLANPMKKALRDAFCRIEAWHRAGMPLSFEIETAPGVRCGRVLRGIARVGLYVPAGSAPLPSTALMLGIPAKLAGCREVVLCSPPRKDGRIDPAVLYAARLCGITRVFKVGGAQAIAAMAYGTDEIPKCHKLFGPGNAYVTAAKQLVAQDANGAAIDMPAGPSEVLVIADAGADPEFVAADLLSQAEHGADSQVILISHSQALLRATALEIERQLDALPRRDIARQALATSRLIRTRTLDDAFDISNAYAPEHLILALRDAPEWLDRVEAAGSVFLGDWTPEALGDYCSGTNHVLPTGGAARALSGLSVSSFQTAISVQQATRQGVRGIGPCAAEIARAEGLVAHERAVNVRTAKAGVS
ncbi:MAG: histidinol dehydrogenase [Pseudomonadota bacterium]|nr:histidinol dehydrogenase [Pseudomonadota bacterium]